MHLTLRPVRVLDPCALAPVISFLSTEHLEKRPGRSRHLHCPQHVQMRAQFLEVAAMHLGSGGSSGWWASARGDQSGHCLL